MRFSFGIYDFLGYTVPGFVAILVILIMIDPGVLTARPFQADEGLEKYLPASVTQGIFTIFICYIVGLVSHGLINALFSLLSKCKVFKRYHSDSGYFEKGLFCEECREKHRDDPDFYPYSDQFVKKLKEQIKNRFHIKVTSIQCEAKCRDGDVQYTEIFDLCRTAFMKHSPDLYRRASNLLALYNCAKILGGIFGLAAIGFFLSIVIPLIVSFNFPLDISEKIRRALDHAWPLFIWLGVLVPLWKAKQDGERGTYIKANRLGFSYWIVVGVFGFILWICAALLDSADNCTTNLFICYWINAGLCPIFFYLYHLFFRYYRNSILYGFYEHAVHAENAESKNKKG